MSWSDDDKDKALEYRRNEAEICNGCGTIPSDWLDDEGVPLEPPPYEVGSRLCVGCKTLATEQEIVSKAKTSGISLFLRRVRRGWHRE